MSFTLYERVIIIEVDSKENHAHNFLPGLTHSCMLEADLIVVFKRKYLKSGLTIESFSIFKDRYQLPGNISRQDFFVLAENAEIVKTIDKKGVVSEKQKK
jgi:hypothetical protein